MASETRRDFLKMKLGASAAFGAGLLAGGAAGAAGMRAHLTGPDHPLEHLRHHSYAQQGEDLVLWNIVAHLELRRVTYLDVGAHLPVEGSNTYLFYERGIRGILVEPNPSLWDGLASVRPRDVLIRGGIGVDGKDSEADYYLINDNGGLNTFSKEVAESYPARTGGKYSIQKVMRMPLFDINGVMEKNLRGAPAVLSVDTEGFDLPILQSIDWKRYRPAVVCVETLEFGSRRLRPATLEFMARQDYDVRGGSFVNTIFVDRKLL